ncbi:hypothetical protein N2152v2_002603 [Parachlorella kessleri]
MAQPHVALTTSSEESADLENQVHKAKGNRFKAVGTVVMAIKRFQASLNPTYSYGKKQAANDSRPTTVSRDRKRAATSSGEVTKGPAKLPSFGRSLTHSSSLRQRASEAAASLGGLLKGGESPTYQHRGNRASMLFRPLPDISVEAR